MHVNRLRIWILVGLLFLYLGGVLILSTITLRDPRHLGNKLSSQQLQISRLRNYEYGFRAPQKHSRIEWCTKLKYLKPSGKVAALASFPGSGNTWLRYLLQQATGIYTGSVYKDYGLLKNGFPAENVMNGSVLLVKTHEWGYRARQPFDKAILLIRSPAAAIQAEFNRQSGGHIGFASPARYRKSKGKFWEHFVQDKLQAWKQTNMDWLYNFTGPTHIIFYEQLVDNVELTLRSIIEFLGMTIDEDLFNCAIQRKEGIYRRKKRLLNFEPYSQNMKDLLKVEQEKIYETIYNFAAPNSR